MRRAAAEPYFAMLERWLGVGLVDDPYQEFMVQEDKVCSNQFLCEACILFDSRGPGG